MFSPHSQILKSLFFGILSHSKIGFSAAQNMLSKVSLIPFRCLNCKKFQNDRKSKEQGGQVLPVVCLVVPLPRRLFFLCISQEFTFLLCYNHSQQYRVIVYPIHHIFISASFGLKTYCQGCILDSRILFWEASWIFPYQWYEKFQVSDEANQNLLINVKCTIFKLQSNYFVSVLLNGVRDFCEIQMSCKCKEYIFHPGKSQADFPL